MRELIEKWDEYLADEKWRRDDDRLLVLAPSFPNFIEWLRRDLLSTSQDKD